MAANVFEGARRITKLIAVLWIVGVLILESQSIRNPYLHAYFEVDSIDSKPIRMDEKKEGCGTDGLIEYLDDKSTNRGTNVSVTLCFKAKEFENSVIKDFNFWRTKRDQKSTLVTELSPAQLSDITNNIAKKFTLTKADEEWADGVVRPKRWKIIQVVALTMVGGLVFIWIFSWILGWVVRGFFGIPSGHDFKP